MGSVGITQDVASLCVPSSSCSISAAPVSPASTRDLVMALYHVTSSELASQELSSHLVSVLGALLLQDTSRASSRGRRGESTPVTTPTRSFGSPQPTGYAEKSPPVPPPILVVCHELLVTLNSYCCFDLVVAQQLPQDLKVRFM